MYVRPAYRGRGSPGSCSPRWRSWRSSRGARCLPGDGQLPAGRDRLYTSGGYEPIPVYGEYVGNPYSVCFAKRLPVAA